MINNQSRIVLLLGILILFCGCGSGPKLVPVTGTVKLDGKPLADANITFLFNEYPRPASARTDSNGAFKLTYSNRLGAPIGACKVMIRKQGKNESGEQVAEIIPSRYNSNTRLTFEVTKSGPNEFNNIDLTSTPDEADVQAQQAPENVEVNDDAELDEGDKAKTPPRSEQRPKKGGKDDEADDGGGE